MANEDAQFDIDNHVALMLERLTSRHRNAQLLRSWITIYGERIQKLEDVLSGITADLLFNIETAIGAQLDQIGSILVFPRQGREDDDEYRVLLRTQALLVLPERRSQKRLMQIIRSLSDTDAGMITYRQFDPKSFSVGVSTVGIETLGDWVVILRRCRPATYNMIVCWFTVGHITMADSTGVEPDPGWVGMADSSGLEPDPGWGGFSGSVPIL